MQYFTPVPNSFFDNLLLNLSPSEIKIYLIILRQTNGWVSSKTGKRKVYDRISHSQFMQKTNLSRRTVSEAIHSLVKKKILLVTDAQKNTLVNAGERRGRGDLYYSVTAKAHNIKCKRERLVRKMATPPA